MPHTVMLNDFTFTSPEQNIIHPLYKSKGISVTFKRDDMIHPFISGNKWRKLKYNLLAAQQEKKQRLVTFGGPWSNHLLATACAGALFDFSTKAIVRGEEVHNPVLDMCRLFGMELQFVDRQLYRERTALWEELESDPTNYLMNEGGMGHAAVRGCEELMDELGQVYDHIFCAAGTGTTAAGIATAIAAKTLSTQLHVVPALKNGGFIAQEMTKLGAPTVQTILHLNYHFGGYAKTQPQLLAFVKEFIGATGIMIEPTYTGKALFALHDQIEQNRFAAGSKILFIHTGGLTGLLGMLDRF